MATLSFPAGNLIMMLGVLLFCAGTLAGIPHGQSKRRGEIKRTELWRIAHLSTCLGGVSLIAMTVALERLLGTAAMYALVPLSLAAYCFFIACTLSGILNKSWDDDRSDPAVKLIYFLQVSAATMSIVAVAAAVAILGQRIIS